MCRLCDRQRHRRGAGVFQQPIAQFSTGVQLVEVYATVTDANGGLVTGLKREDFEVQEDQERRRSPRLPQGSSR